MKSPKAAVPVAVALVALAVPTLAPGATRTLKPQYVSPPELVDMLGVTEAAGLGVLRWTSDDREHLVTVRRNDAANLILLEGEPGDLERVASHAEAFDVAPRQIALEARIIEVDTDRARDLGIDWSNVSTNLSADFTRQVIGRSSVRTNRTGSGFFDESRSESQDRVMADNERASIGFSNQLRLLEERGAARFHDAPRLLTLNNRPATVLDGFRVTYVNRANGYANIYETETMDAGLRLEVTPSLLESGYLRLGIRAEMSNLLQVELGAFPGAARDYANISGSPIKRGQIVENTVMVKDGETIVLGGFTRTTDVRSRRDFPLLGRVLPFLFSRHVVTQRHHENLIVITPRVVDLAGSVSPREKELIGK